MIINGTCQGTFRGSAKHSAGLENPDGTTASRKKCGKKPGQKKGQGRLANIWARGWQWLRGGHHALDLQEWWWLGLGLVLDELQQAMRGSRPGRSPSSSKPRTSNSGGGHTPRTEKPLLTTFEGPLYVEDSGAHLRPIFRSGRPGKRAGCFAWRQGRNFRCGSTSTEAVDGCFEPVGAWKKPEHEYRFGTRPGTRFPRGSLLRRAWVSENAPHLPRGAGRIQEMAQIAACIQGKPHRRKRPDALGASAPIAELSDRRNWLAGSL